MKGETLMTAPAPASVKPPPPPPPPPPPDNSDASVEKVRAWAGLIAVVAGDAAIAIAAILGITHFTASGTPSSQVLPQIVAILSGAFTAIGTMTTAYFGIKAMSNTAKNLAKSK